MTMKVLDSLPASLDEVPTPWRYAGAGVLVVAGLTLASQVEQLVRRAVVSRRRKAVRQEIRRDKEEFAREIRRKQPGDSHERICALSLQDLQKELQQETLTPSQVLLAYWRKAVDLDDKTNCVAAYIKEAEIWAKQLDKAKEKGPFYGIPISVKEIHAFKGYPIAMGVYHRMDQLAKETFVPYKVMQNQGAIPFVTSSSPYLGLSYTCWNPLNDDGRNPLDLTRQPGGSSGGEGALVAGGASVLGFGSDVAGSIRCPSSWCGIVGLKCCSMRLSARGNLFDDNTLLPTSYGPMVRDVDSAAFVMRHLLVEDMWKMDGVAPLPWRDEIYRDRGPLRIGFYENNGQFRAAPCMERAVRLAKEKLEAQGHTLVPFEIPLDDGSGDWTYMEMIHRLLRGDGAKTDLGFMGNDLPGRYLVMATKPFQNMPRWLNILVSKLMKAFSRRKGDRMEYGCGAKDVYDWWGLTLKITAWRRHTLDAFHGAGLDAVLCPAFSAPAMPMDQMWPIDDLGSYTFVYNLLDWAGGVVPVTKVTEADIADMKDYPKEEPFYSLIQKGMEGAVGLPVAVQVAVPPFQEELCLRVLKQLEDASK